MVRRSSAGLALPIASVLWLAASTFGATGCDVFGSDCKELHLKAFDALDGSPVKVVATDQDGQPVAGIDIAFKLLRYPTEVKFVDVEHYRTDTHGVMTYPQTVIPFIYLQPPKLYRAFPVEQWSGNADFGYCSNVTSTARFSTSVAVLRQLGVPPRKIHLDHAG